MYLPEAKLHTDVSQSATPGVPRGPSLVDPPGTAALLAPPPPRQTFPVVNLLGVDLVIFGLAAVDGFHRERMPQDKRNPFSRAQVGKPIPGEDTFDTHDQILPIGRDSREERVWTRFHIAVHKNLSIPV